MRSGTWLKSVYASYHLHAGHNATVKFAERLVNQANLNLTQATCTDTQLKMGSHELRPAYAKEYLCGPSSLTITAKRLLSRLPIEMSSFRSTHDL